MRNLIKSIVTVGGYTLLYRITSVFRDVLQAKFLGASFLSDVFALVFHLANIMRKVFAEGAFNASFLPKFVEILKNRGRDAAVLFSSQIFTILFAGVLIFTAYTLYYFPEFMMFYAPRFVGTEKFVHVVALGRICFFYVSASFIFALFSGILNGINKFAIPTASQLILNIFLILALIIGAYFDDETIVYGMCYATSLAGLAQVLILWINAKYHGIKISFKYHVFTPDTKEVFKKMIPGAIGCGVWPINTLLDMVIAATIGTGATSYLYYTDHISQFILSVLGIALTIGVLPYVATSAKSGDFKLANSQLNASTIFGMGFALPLSAIFMAIPETITSVMYECGKFDAADVHASAPALAAFSFGIPAYILTKIFSTAFFAQGFTKIPSIIGVFSIVVNLSFIYILIPYYAHTGIAMATTIAAWFNAFALYVFMVKDGKFSITKSIKIKILKLTLISIIVALISYFLDLCCVEFYTSKFLKGTILLLNLSFCGAFTYFVGKFAKSIE